MSAQDVPPFLADLQIGVFMSRTPVSKSLKQPKALTRSLSDIVAASEAHLPSVHPALGEHRHQAVAIPETVHTRFAPKDPYEALLVEEISDLTRRIRLDERRLEQIPRIKRNEFLLAALKSASKVPGGSPRQRDNEVNSILRALNSTDSSEVANAEQ